MCTHQDWFIRLSKLHCWAYFHWLFFSEGLGRGESFISSVVEKLDLLKHLSSSLLSIVTVCVVGEGGDGGLPGRPFGYWNELLHRHSQPRTPMKNVFIKAYHDRIGIQRKQVYDSFIVPSAHNLLIQQEALKAMEGAVLMISPHISLLAVWICMASLLWWATKLYISTLWCCLLINHFYHYFHCVEY